MVVNRISSNGRNRDQRWGILAPAVVRRNIQLTLKGHRRKVIVGRSAWGARSDRPYGVETDPP